MGSSSDTTPEVVWLQQTRTFIFTPKINLSSINIYVV